jgi:Skp family chaperone for outer membrane proteins
MFWLGSVVVAVAVLVGAGRLWAEGKDKKPAKPADSGTRIALVNLTYVVKNYEKYKHFQEDIKKVLAPFQETEKELRKEAEGLSKQITPNTPAEERTEIEGKLKDLQRQLEDNNAKAKRVLSKKSDEQLKIIYADLTEAAQRYAVGHNFDLVLHYNDATTKEEILSSQNIARKIQTGALVPLYAAPGMDISVELVKNLNENVKKD